MSDSRAHVELARRDEHQPHADRVDDLRRHAEVLGPRFLKLFCLRRVERSNCRRRAAGREHPFAVGADEGIWQARLLLRAAAFRFGERHIHLRVRADLDLAPLGHLHNGLFAVGVANVEGDGPGNRPRDCQQNHTSGCGKRFLLPCQAAARPSH